MMTASKIAKKVRERWNNLVAGQYVPPACPPLGVLTRIVEIINYAAGFPEEGRYPRFNVTITLAGTDPERVWRFSHPRTATVAELRRVLPAVNPRKSAVHIEWQNDNSVHIVGIHDMGTSWHRARVGLEYRYETPNAMLIEVERPNRFHIYQGQFRVATFSDGELDVAHGVPLTLFLHTPAEGGLSDLSERIVRPVEEPPREYFAFEFMALWNCYAAIVNSIVLAGHGGALILLPEHDAVETSLLRVKYRMREPGLANAFVSFINARHQSVDMICRRDSGEDIAPELLSHHDATLGWALNDLVENVRLAAQFAECDGAVVLTRALEVLGFGCEIAAELEAGASVYEVTDETRKVRRPLNVEHFGMRHRSAVKLVSQYREAVVLVVSQDGPVSGVWGDSEGIYVRRGLRLVNANLPWA